MEEAACIEHAELKMIRSVWGHFAGIGLNPEDASGSTFTITNAGAAGSLYATPLLNPPEAAILGVGAIRKRVVPLEDGSIGIRDRMGVSLSVDHRVVDGMLAAQFNRVVCQNLEQFDFSVLD